MKRRVTLLSLLVFFAISVVVLILLILVSLFCYMGYILWSIEHGHHWKGISHKYHVAMTDGDGQAAIYWAKKNYAYKILGKPGPFHDTELWIAQAYELDGQFEMALLWYAISEKAGEKDGFASGISFARSQSTLQGRLHFKLGNRKEAFESYIASGMWTLENFASVRELEQNADRPGTGAYFERRRRLAGLRDAITMSQTYHAMRLTPFLDYKDFVVFMEEEYEKLGHPAEHAEVMELFRTIYSEIGEEDVNTSGATDMLNRMRETIRQERAHMN